MTKPDELKAAIAAIPDMTLAAKLRHLMPEIDRRAKDGVPYEVIRETLKSHGLEVSAHAFRTYLYRWRKAQAGKAASEPSPGAVPRQQAAPASKPPQNAGPEPLPKIRNKGDLAELRKKDHDLDELANYGKTKE